MRVQPKCSPIHLHLRYLTSWVLIDQHLACRLSRFGRLLELQCTCGSHLNEPAVLGEILQYQTNDLMQQNTRQKRNMSHKILSRVYNGVHVAPPKAEVCTSTSPASACTLGLRSLQRISSSQTRFTSGSASSSLFRIAAHAASATLASASCNLAASAAAAWAKVSFMHQHLGQLLN